ncbi:MAG: hypothetical protein AAB697_03945 [Patescibacteria group bacterium]
MSDVSAAVEFGEAVPVLPRVLGELADVVDKISGTKLPLTHGQVWMLIGLMAAGVGIEEYHRTMPRPERMVGDAKYTIGWIKESLSYGGLGRDIVDPVAKTALKGQIELFEEMVREKNFGAALAVAGGAAMVSLGNISEHANKPVRISDKLGRLPGLGEIVSRQLRNMSKLVQTK